MTYRQEEVRLSVFPLLLFMVIKTAEDFPLLVIKCISGVFTDILKLQQQALTGYSTGPGLVGSKQARFNVAHPGDIARYVLG